MELKTVNYRVMYKFGIPVKYRVRGHAWTTMDQAPRSLSIAASNARQLVMTNDSETVLDLSVNSPYTRVGLYLKRKREAAAKKATRRKAA